MYSAVSHVLLGPPTCSFDPFMSPGPLKGCKFQSHDNQEPVLAWWSRSRTYIFTSNSHSSCKYWNFRNFTRSCTWDENDKLHSCFGWSSHIAEFLAVARENLYTQKWWGESRFLLTCQRQSEKQSFSASTVQTKLSVTGDWVMKIRTCNYDAPWICTGFLHMHTYSVYQCVTFASKTGWWL